MLNDSDAFLILNATRGLGNARIKKLVEHFGSARAVLSAGGRRLTAARLIPEDVVENILHFRGEEFLRKEWLLINKSNINIVKYTDFIYPEHLKAIPDAPVVLYLKGTFPARHRLAIAIVGSRRASLYGLTMAEKFAGELAQLGITVVSGLARGIDTSAHQGALKAKGSTLAVVGCGLAHIYPPENRELYERIAENGAVISEFPMEVEPLPHNFPRRNRIISGLSLGVIVIEASRRSGALITADQALDQGREVFALPGRVDHPNSQGVHGLIKQGAKLVHSVEDVLEELKPQLDDILKNHRESSQDSQLQSHGKMSSVKLTDSEKDFLDLFSDRPFHVDELARLSGTPVAGVMATLLRLELKRIVRQRPGKMFVKKIAKGY